MGTGYLGQIIIWVDVFLVASCKRQFYVDKELAMETQNVKFLVPDLLIQQFCGVDSAVLFRVSIANTIGIPNQFSMSMLKKSLRACWWQQCCLATTDFQFLCIC